MCTIRFPPFFSLYRSREERGGLRNKGTIEMKKTLAALAVLGAFAGSAVAADVTLYGLVDYGFNYQHVDADTNADAQDSFRMMSGQNSGSRFGLKGTEDLGNGLTVGFVLENGFNADDGTLGNGGRLFGRESQVYLKGNFGTLSFGRVGQFASANGSYQLLGKASPFSGGWQDSVGQKFVYGSAFDRFDNMITYVTPSFNGFKVHAQYSFDTNTKNDNSAVDGTQHGTEGKSTVDRYYAVAATYESQNLYLVGIVDSMNWGRVQYKDLPTGEELDDQIDITLGGAYDFQVVKVYATGQYFMNATTVGYKSAFEQDSTIGDGYKFGVAEEGADGFGIALGVGVPAFGGTAKAQIGYMTAEANKATGWDGDKKEIDRWDINVGYDYNLSKRTSVYTALAYTKDSMKNWEEKDRDPSTIEFMAGMIHKF